MNKNSIIKFSATLLLILSFSGCSSDTKTEEVEVTTLTSNESWAEYTINNIVEVPDDNLKAAINRSLGLDDDHNVTKETLEGLTVLYASNMEIEDLTGLENATSLKEVYLQDNSIDDLTPLSELTSIETLNIDNNRPQLVRQRSLDGSNFDLSVLSNLSNLKKLSTSGNQLDDNDIDTISSMRLNSLNISNNKITKIPLKTLTDNGLESLSANDNKIKEITGMDTINRDLRNLNNTLKSLELSGNQISSQNFATHLGGLEKLKIENNNLDGSTAFTKLNKLKSLSMNGNQISPSNARTTSKVTSIDAVEYGIIAKKDCSDSENDLYNSFSDSMKSCIDNAVLTDKDGERYWLADYTQSSLCNIRELNCGYPLSEVDRSYFPKAFVLDVPESQVTKIEIEGENNISDGNTYKYTAIAYYDDDSVSDVTTYVNWFTTLGKIDNIEFVETKNEMTFDNVEDYSEKEEIPNPLRGTLTLATGLSGEALISISVLDENGTAVLSDTLGITVNGVSADAELLVSAPKAVIEVGEELLLDAWKMFDSGKERASRSVVWSVEGSDEYNNTIADIANSSEMIDTIRKPSGLLKAKETGLIKVTAQWEDKSASKWIEIVENIEIDSAPSLSFDIFASLGFKNKCLSVQEFNSTTLDCNIPEDKADLFVAGAGKTTNSIANDNLENIDLDEALLDSDIINNRVKYDVDEEATQVFDELREHLCTITQTMYFHEKAVEAGTFKSIVNLNNCFDGGDYNKTVPFIVSVEADEFTNSYPMTVKFWGYTQNEDKDMERVTARMKIYEQPNDRNLFGLFDMDMQIRKNDTTIPLFFKAILDESMNPVLTYVAPDKRARFLLDFDGRGGYGKVAYYKDKERLYSNDGTSQMQKEEVQYDVAFNDKYLIRQSMSTSQSEAFNMQAWSEDYDKYNLYYAKDGSKVGANSVNIKAVKTDGNSTTIYNETVEEGKLYIDSDNLYDMITNLDSFSITEKETNRAMKLKFSNGTLVYHEEKQGDLSELSNDFISGFWYDGANDAYVKRYINWYDGGFKLASLTSQGYLVSDESDLSVSDIKYFVDQDWDSLFGFSNTLGLYTTYSDINSSTPTDHNYATTYYGHDYVVITPKMTDDKDIVLQLDVPSVFGDLDEAGCNALNDSNISLEQDIYDVDGYSGGFYWDGEYCMPNSSISYNQLEQNQDEYTDNTSCIAQGYVWDEDFKTCDVCSGNSIDRAVSLEEGNKGATYAQFVFDVSAQALRELSPDGTYGRCLTIENSNIAYDDVTGDTNDYMYLYNYSDEKVYEYWFNPAETTVQLAYSDTNEPLGFNDKLVFEYSNDGETTDSITIVGSDAKAQGIPMSVTNNDDGKLYSDGYDLPYGTKQSTVYGGTEYYILPSSVKRKPAEVSLDQIESLAIKTDAVTLPSFDEWIGDEPDIGDDEALFGDMSRDLNSELKVISVNGKVVK